MRVVEPPGQADHMELAAHPIAPSFAHRLVERALAKWGLGELETVVNLVMTELVTNAVNATSGDISAFNKEGEISGIPQCIRAGLYRVGDAVVIEVWDAGRTPPKLTDATLDDECGPGPADRRGPVRRVGVSVGRARGEGGVGEVGTALRVGPGQVEPDRMCPGVVRWRMRGEGVR